jgi:hypothetical protein
MPIFGDLWDDLRSYLAEHNHIYDCRSWQKLSKKYDGWYNVKL